MILRDENVSAESTTHLGMWKGSRGGQIQTRNAKNRRFLFSDQQLQSGHDAFYSHPFCVFKQEQSKYLWHILELTILEPNISKLTAFL